MALLHSPCRSDLRSCGYVTAAQHGGESGVRMSTSPGPRAVELFDRDAANFEDYLHSPLGRLRTELIWCGLETVLSPLGQDALAPRVLDVGGGTGAFALRLAAQGCRVLLLDPAQGMLDLALVKARHELTDQERRNLRVQQGTVETLSSYAVRRKFHLVLCHNVLEYVVGPNETLRRIRQCIAPTGVLSLVVANRDVEPLRTAITEQDPTQALQLLDKAVFPSRLFGGYRRAFTLRELIEMLDSTRFRSISVRGIRVVSDYFSQEQLERPEQWEALFALEQHLAERAPHKYLARYFHILAQPQA